jgi:Erythronolide synthase docking domain
MPNEDKLPGYLKRVTAELQHTRKPLNSPRRPGTRRGAVSLSDQRLECRPCPALVQ